jgi:hypothetical protein
MSSETETPPRFVTLTDAAKILGIDPRTVRSLVDEGRPEVFRTPGRIMVSLASIEALPHAEAPVLGGPDHG